VARRSGCYVVARAELSLLPHSQVGSRQGWRKANKAATSPFQDGFITMEIEQRPDSATAARRAAQTMRALLESL